MEKQLSLFPQLETLIIIGNGFDLAHGIESGYCNFKSWLIANNNESFVDFMDIFFSNQRDVWSAVEQALGEYDEESILDFCRPEEEFDYDHSLSSSARIEDSPMAVFQPVLSGFKDFFCDWVNSIEINGIKKVYSLSPQCHYLTFNYTDTLETSYGIPDSQVAHIHGSRLVNDELVIGHNNYCCPTDVWNEDGIIFEQQAHENIITWMNEFFKDYASNIQKHQNFFDSLRNVEQILVYGHSMTEIDWPYFKEIIEILGQNIPWKVDCFSREDVNNTDKFTCFFNLTDVTKLNMK